MALALFLLILGVVRAEGFIEEIGRRELNLGRRRWEARPFWLANPASTATCRDGDDGTVFRVAEPQRGMKWQWRLPEPVGLRGRRYLVLRYRAQGAAPTGDYARSILGMSAADGDWDLVSTELGPHGASCIVVDSAGRTP